MKIYIVLFMTSLMFGDRVASQPPTNILLNGFANADLFLNGIADIKSGVLRLTNTTARLLGRAFHPQPVVFANNRTKSFSTSFVFDIKPLYPALGGHGLAFVMTPFLGLPGGLPSQYFGILNATSNNHTENHLFAVEFDTVQDFEFEDINDNHVGVNINSLISHASTTVALKTGPKINDTQELALKSAQNMRVWVDYEGNSDNLSIWMAPVKVPKPAWPLLSTKVNLKDMFLNKMYIGFSSSTGLLSSTHHIKGWSFSTNGTAMDLDIDKLPSIPADPHRLHRTVVMAAVSSAVAVLLAVLAALLIWRAIRNHEEIEEWELECGPHRYTYRELSVATKGFRDDNLLGFGGFGRVYKGVLPGSRLEVAVKRVSHDSKQGLREFAAEISSIGRLRHRNLVQLLGWCRLKSELLLVYDFMPHGSLDKLLFDHAKNMLTWSLRYEIMKGVAAALLYLHEEWEQRVVHRDIKASNVMLDAEFNARLGDFGLARLYEHGKNPHTTKVVGTLGYLAPELTRTGKATSSTDVFSYGALLLEIACGKRPMEVTNDETMLVEWVWDMYSRGRLLDCADVKLHGDYVSAEMTKVLKLGLICSHFVPDCRPSMRQVVQILAGDCEMPAMPEHPVYIDDSPMSHFTSLFSTGKREHSETHPPESPMPTPEHENTPVLSSSSSTYRRQGSS